MPSSSSFQFRFLACWVTQASLCVQVGGCSGDPNPTQGTDGECARGAMDRKLPARVSGLDADRESATLSASSTLARQHPNNDDERPHRSRNLRPPAAHGDPPTVFDGRVERGTRLGGLLSDYHYLSAAA